MFGDAFVQGGVFRRVNVVHPAAQHRRRAGLQRSVVRRPINAPREAGDDEEARLAQIARQLPREPLAAGRGDARADDGDSGAG